MRSLRAIMTSGLFVAAVVAPGGAGAWEVIGGGALPTFAAGAVSGGVAGVSDALVQPYVATSAANWAPGYSLRVGRDFLLGADQTTNLALANPFASAAGFGFSSSNAKFGYDLGRFKPFVSASFSELRAPAVGANPFATGGAGFSNAMSGAAKTTTVGAGFDYAITDKLSFGMSVSASQTSAGRGW